MGCPLPCRPTTDCVVLVAGDRPCAAARWRGSYDVSGAFSVLPSGVSRPIHSIVGPPLTRFSGARAVNQDCVASPR
jgi:hypothetical protein